MIDNDCCKKLLCVNNFEKQSLQKLEEISNSEQHQHYLLCCQRCLLFGRGGKSYNSERGTIDLVQQKE